MFIWNTLYNFEISQVKCVVHESSTFSLSRKLQESVHKNNKFGEFELNSVRVVDTLIFKLPLHHKVFYQIDALWSIFFCK